MAGSAEKVLADKKIELPKAAAPVANYVPVVMAGGLAFVSGQVTVWNGEFKFIGRLGKDYTIEQGQQAARICGLNILAQLRAALGGSLDRVKRCVKLGVFVNSAESFTDLRRCRQACPLCRGHQRVAAQCCRGSGRGLRGRLKALVKTSAIRNPRQSTD